MIKEFLVKTRDSGSRPLVELLFRYGVYARNIPTLFLHHPYPIGQVFFVIEPLGLRLYFANPQAAYVPVLHYLENHGKEFLVKTGAFAPPWRLGHRGCTLAIRVFTSSSLSGLAVRKSSDLRPSYATA